MRSAKNNAPAKKGADLAARLATHNFNFDRVPEELPNHAPLSVAVTFVAALCLACVVGIAGQSARANGKAWTQNSKTGAADAEIKRLQGKWQVIRWQDETGQQLTPEEVKEFTFYFEGDQLTMHKFKDDPGTRCQFRIDVTRQPKWIDLGMPTLAAGSTVLEGIYSLEGDELTLCITSGLRNGVAPPRPTEFKTGPTEKYAVLSLKRIP